MPGRSSPDLLVVQFALAQPGAKGVAGGRLGARTDQGIQNPVLGRPLGLGADLVPAAVTHDDQRCLDQIAQDLVNVAPDIADLREFGRFNLEERRAGQPGQAPGNLGLADAGRPDHQDVLGRYLISQRVRHTLAPPAVAQRQRDGALGVGLTDNEAVQFGDDFAGREVSHSRPPIVSTVRLPLV